MEWLAGLFLAPPTADTVTSYRHGLGAMLLEELEQQPGCHDGAGRMEAALTNPGTPVMLARQFGTAFMHLFEGAGGPGTVSPFESAHLGPRGRLFQAPATDMDRLLARADLRPASGPSEPSDHLSMELALMAHMLRVQAGRQAVASLLDRRLLNWVPGFAQAVQAADHTGFYAGAASLLVGFLRGQRRAVARIGSHPSGPPDHIIGDMA